MEEVLRGKDHICEEEVKAAVLKWVKEQSTEFDEESVHALIRRWGIAIERNNDYIGK